MWSGEVWGWGRMVKDEYEKVKKSLGDCYTLADGSVHVSATSEKCY